MQVDASKDNFDKKLMKAIEKQIKRQTEDYSKTFNVKVIDWWKLKLSEIKRQSPHLKEEAVEKKESKVVVSGKNLIVLNYGGTIMDEQGKAIPIAPLNFIKQFNSYIKNMKFLPQ